MCTQQMMGAVDKFLHKLENFDKENIPPKVIKALQPYLKVKFLIMLFHCVAANICVQRTIFTLAEANFVSCFFLSLSLPIYL